MGLGWGESLQMAKQVWQPGKERGKEDWVGRVSDCSAILKKVLAGLMVSLLARNNHWGTPMSLKNNLALVFLTMVGHWLETSWCVCVCSCVVPRWTHQDLSGSIQSGGSWRLSSEGDLSSTPTRLLQGLLALKMWLEQNCCYCCWYLVSTSFKHTNITSLPQPLFQPSQVLTQRRLNCLDHKLSIGEGKRMTPSQIARPLVDKYGLVDSQVHSEIYSSLAWRS